MQDLIVNFLKEKGVSEDILTQITSKLEGVTSMDKVKEVLEGFKDKLPEGIMDNLPQMPDMSEGAGGLLNKAKDMLGGMFGGK